MKSERSVTGIYFKTTTGNKCFNNTYTEIHFVLKFQYQETLVNEFKSKTVGLIMNIDLLTLYCSLICFPVE